MMTTILIAEAIVLVVLVAINLLANYMVCGTREDFFRTLLLTVGIQLATAPIVVVLMYLCY